MKTLLRTIAISCLLIVSTQINAQGIFKHIRLDGYFVMETAKPEKGTDFNKGKVRYYYYTGENPDDLNNPLKDCEVKKHMIPMYSGYYKADEIYAVFLSNAKAEDSTTLNFIKPGADLYNEIDNDITPKVFRNIEPSSTPPNSKVTIKRTVVKGTLSTVYWFTYPLKINCLDGQTDVLVCKNYYTTWDASDGNSLTYISTVYY